MGNQDFWPLRSPDLTPCDFFLWGYVKEAVYIPPLPTTLADLTEEPCHYCGECSNTRHASLRVGRVWLPLRLHNRKSSPKAKQPSDSNHLKHCHTLALLRHLGMPHHEKVTLFNVNNNKTIHMSSISGNTVHFHSSFFEDKIIPPLGNTSFNVVFLGREEGEIESNLFIHTSEGSFKYQVKGASVSSPYRLRPLVGVRVPLNSTYSPLIYMHNPHTTPMQIVEVYSSGGEFHLELPSGELEGPKHLWEIPPFHTKPVIRIRFVAKAEKNHTAYIRSLGYGTTSFDGEIIAISESLRNLLCHISKFKNAVILSDSKAAILSIVSKHTPSSQTAEITKMLSQLISLNKRIVFQWIPSHCGILGNENVDALAKKGSTATYRPVTKSTYYSVKRFIKSTYLDFNKQNLITQSHGKKWNSLHQNPQIKVNKSEEVLVVPLEVEVAPHAGLYSPDDVLDFGIGGSRDKPKEVRLLLYNSWKKMIRIQNIITTPVSKALKIDFQPVKVPPDSKSPTQVAVLTFDWKASFESKHFSGKLVIKSKQSQHKVVIPYIAHVLEGGLEFNASVTQYCSDLGLNLGVRNFTVTNAFKIPVALVNVSLPKEAQAHFTIQNFSPTILAPGEKVVLFQLTIKKETIESELKLESNLLLHTNISTVSIPLLCYNGRLMKVDQEDVADMIPGSPTGGFCLQELHIPEILQELQSVDCSRQGEAEQSDGITVFHISTMTSLMLHQCRTGAISLQRWWQSPSAAISESDWFLYRAGISRRMTSCTVVSWRCVLLRFWYIVILSGFNESELNFGTVGSTSQKEAHFAVVNNNPVAVLLKSWGTNMTGALVELVGVEEGNRSTVLQRHSFSNMSTTLVLMPGHYAVFRVFVEAPKTEGAILAEVFVKTQFERVVIPARMTVAHGNLEVLPESLVLDDCFPIRLLTKSWRKNSKSGKRDGQQTEFPLQITFSGYP
ncbi:hypothetical protein ANN_11241 [Periplaneta americana]|uniref:RNase H type-1 domain-containing protein n=1 Tax=Periplaneta americana TaxID=6978 RepID=A0ABQ8T4G2_PERAM|nr:hypothetical protein ANN_11241 [Periplaneta americana]